MMPVSLMVGSDDLGWVEVGGKALLGEMTKAMPGGDGSLGFALYGDDAMKARNVLVPGEARAVLRAGIEPIWGGRIVSDPLRHRLSCQDVVGVSCAGLYSLAARNGEYAYVAVDTDPEQWRQFRSVSEHSGRFTVRTEGMLEIRADNDRTYAANDAGGIYYWLHNGLIDGTFLPGISSEYECHLPTSDWWAAILAGTDPVDAASGLAWWEQQGPLTVATWTTLDVPYTLDAPYPCVMLRLRTTDAGSPATDPYVRLRKVRALGRHVGTFPYGSPDTDVTLGDILADLAAELGVTNVSIDSTLTAFSVDQFVARYPTDVAETLRQACALYTSDVEVWCDLDPADASERFSARVRPADTALVGNRLVVVGGRGGEDTRGLERDWEATPDQVSVLYACRDDGTLPDGTVCIARYPASTTVTYPLVLPLDLTDRNLMTAATATNYATASYAYRQSNRYTGEVSVGRTVHDEHGNDLPSYLVRPGDRLTALDLDDTDRFGETLYMQRMSYDWRTGRGTITVGCPFDPLETAWNGSIGTRGRGPGDARRPHPGGYHVRTGIA